MKHTQFLKLVDIAGGITPRYSNYEIQLSRTDKNEYKLEK